jgi:D-arabinose 1-dehydrogenase
MSLRSQKNPALSQVLPPLVLGTATFNNQYNTDALSLPSTPIVHRALNFGIVAFDTSPYYGPAESLLGAALKCYPGYKRSEHFLQTKCGRISSDKFDYSPAWIRQSVQRSLERLSTDYLDLVFCHDVEFVSPAEVLVAVKTLRELRDQGLIRYIGISGYPLDVLCLLSQQVKEMTGEPLDAVMSYAQYTLQNTALHTKGLDKLVSAGVDCVLSGSPLGMGLLRSQGVPIGALGDFHPAPAALRERCLNASMMVQATGRGRRLEELAMRFALEGWAKDGSAGGTTAKPRRPVMLPQVGLCVQHTTSPRTRVGVSVVGVSFLEELEQILKIWDDVLEMLEREMLYGEVQKMFGKQWKDYTWLSPGRGYVEGKESAMIKSSL